ncbi:uncharacterized protein BJ171DRAFT_532590 [Polychytrium aggregatum]|uniref:uncharacterized protein n=1 Tax=Polychytrium aggregatum TaxID=110093 RepID=UPI0022FEE737|nr:uncharacterized protein BJ171DRAFT_532590 [Polychytrium aggregatum]KAI9193170.1 hypothetical protein BJ171DRAFT_532590 [Polychytrium aggregatum]
MAPTPISVVRLSSRPLVHTATARRGLADVPVKAKAAPRFGKVTLSGIQPTGIPHLGNYLGALQNWARIQHDKTDPDQRYFYMAADLHAITVPQNPKDLHRQIEDAMIAILACGIDPKKSVLFQQSMIPQHSELAWIMFCRTPVGWLSRMHQWKSKLQALQKASGSASQSLAATTLSLDAVAPTSGDGPDPTQGLCVGLFAYPVLQAADILLYKATEVPVGEDQVQHLELTAEIARIFNNSAKKDLFPIPKAVLPTAGAKRIMSLKDPHSKMSKSDPNAGSRINIDDTPEQISSKIKKATVDSIRGITYDPAGRPGIANLLSIYCSLHPTETDPVAVAEQFQSLGNAEFKKAVADVVIESLTPVRNEIARLRHDRTLLHELLREGNQAATATAERTLTEVKRSVGLLP